MIMQASLGMDITIAPGALGVAAATPAPASATGGAEKSSTISARDRRHGFRHGAPACEPQGAARGGARDRTGGQAMMNQIVEKLRTIKTIVGSIEKQFGKGAIM